VGRINIARRGNREHTCTRKKRGEVRVKDKKGFGKKGVARKGKKVHQTRGQRNHRKEPGGEPIRDNPQERKRKGRKEKRKGEITVKRLKKGGRKKKGEGKGTMTPEVN